MPPIPFTVLDTETTGFIPRVHRVIECASVTVRDGKITDAWEQLFSIPGDIPPQVQVLTRIRPADLQSKPRLEEVNDDVLTHLPADTLLVGQNLSFDIGMLHGEGIDLTERPWVDTSLLASLVFPELKSYSLQYMSSALKLHHEPAHRAMGDVRATLELFGKIWERLEALPPDLLQTARASLSRSTPGLRMLAETLESHGTKPPAWMQHERIHTIRNTKYDIRNTVIPPPSPGTVALHEESLDPSALQMLVNATAADRTATHWIAVKNLEGMLRNIHLPENAQVLYPPALLLDTDAAERLTTQESLTAEEATLATKISWFHPVRRSDIAVHGAERDVWNGKLACTNATLTYVRQFEAQPSIFILDHKQLLSFLQNPDHTAHGALEATSHIIIDDASMLEDTATKAYGHFCALDDLRAAAQGDLRLMKLADLAALWAEKMRQTEDTHLLTRADLARTETKGMQEQIATMLEDREPPERMRHLLTELQYLLRRQTLDGEIRWIEARPNGSIHIHGVPERIDAILERTLYKRFPTTLVVPEGSNGLLPEILPPSLPTTPVEPRALPSHTVRVVFREDLTLSELLRSPPTDRTIILAGSKRMIEQHFITYTEALEARGISLICQGLSGGQARMEADFLAAEPPVIWLLTPWMYEGVELSDQSVDHLILETVPFDHPGHPVFARRKNHYKNAFDEYCLPRVEHRLFRLLRAFCRHRTFEGDVQILDRRLKERSYGARIRSYIETVPGVTMKLAESGDTNKGSSPSPSPLRPKSFEGRGLRRTGDKGKQPEGQPSLFG